MRLLDAESFSSLLKIRILLPWVDEDIADDGKAALFWFLK